MLETAVQGICRDMLIQDYPHIAYPALLRATVTAAAQGPELREPVEAIDTDTGQRYALEIIRHRYTYTLRVQTQPDADTVFPPLPGVASTARYAVGDEVIIGLPGGALQPVILGGI